MDRDERLRLAREISRQYPDWGYRKVNEELKRRTGQGLDTNVIVPLVTQTKAETYSRHARIRMAEDMFRRHPDWGYRRVNRELRKRTGKGLDDHLVREIKRRTLGAKKKPARYITYFSAGGTDTGGSDPPSISSRAVLGTTSWPYRIKLEELLLALDEGIPYVLPVGPYRLKDFTIWSYLYQVFKYDDVAEEYKLIEEESDGNRAF